MRAVIVRRITVHIAGDAADPWDSVIEAAEREPHARVPGSLRHDLKPMGDVALRAPITAAAVLVPILEREAGMTVLLTRRPEHLSSHAGQISFPGGRIEEGDSSPVETALRETEEEVGIARERVETIGRLDNYVVGTGYRITPVVGLVDPPGAFVLDEREVAEVFEVPLDFVCDPANYRRECVEVQGRLRRFHVLPYGDRYIWGATAAILVNLREALAG